MARSARELAEDIDFAVDVTEPRAVLLARFEAIIEPELAALRGELARLTEQVATLTTWHEADQADIGRLEKELRLNAKMLARQCDLARDAENACSAQQAQIPDIVRLLKCVRPLDCGAHYCRYCPAKSPTWDHGPSCPYEISQQEYDEARAMIEKLSALLIPETPHEKG